MAVADGWDSHCHAGTKRHIGGMGGRGRVVKLWKKLSLITVTALMVSMGAAGAAAIYHSALYIEGKTVESYEQQLKAAAYAIGKELDYEPLAGFQEATVNAYYHYVLQKFDASSYILLEGDKEVCNMTPFALANAGDSRWGSEEGYSAIQQNGGRYVLAAGRKVPVVGEREYKLVLVRDISAIYADIRSQAFFYLAVYFGTASLAVCLVFFMTKRTLGPLQELQQAAQDISGGKLERRARVGARDEIGQMAGAFNRMAAQIENQVKELREESERRKLMLGSLAHEMKTPMTSILGYASSLLHVNLKEEQKEKALQHIYEECGRLERVSSKLMSLIGMYENDRIEWEEVPARALLERVSLLEEGHCKEKHITLAYECGAEKWLVDEDLMISLLLNLVDNAVKACQDGGNVTITAQGGRITVRDDGCGIPKEEVPRLTEAFYMVDKARSRKAGGSGLGLALCDRIAGLHGARLEIESILGEGTAVSVVFERFYPFMRK